MRRLLTILSLIQAIPFSIAAQQYSNELEKRAKSGDSQAQYEIGMCYRYGYNISINYKKAYKWFQAAAKQSNPESSFEIAKMIIEGQIEGNPDVWLNQAAEYGDFTFRKNIVDFLVSMNKSYEAIDILKKIADTDDIYIKMWVAEKYVRLEKKLLASTLLKETAKEGDKEQKLIVARKMLSLNLKLDAEMMLNDFATSGDSQQKFEIGEIYQKLGADYTKLSERWIDRAAEDGNAQAQYMRGIRLMGTQSSREDGVKWLNESAEQGYEPAKQKLSELQMEERKRAEMASQQDKWNPKLIIEGRELPPYTYVLGHYHILTHSYKAESMNYFKSLCSDFRSFKKMDELDYAQYKRTDQYNIDLAEFNEKRNNELFALIRRRGENLC